MKQGLPVAARFPERIICMTEETTEWLYLLGEQHRVVSISGYTVRPPEARKEKPKISAFTSAKIPKIMELEPDLVIGFSDMQAEIAVELIRASGGDCFGELTKYPGAKDRIIEDPNDMVDRNPDILQPDPAAQAGGIDQLQRIFSEWASK